MKELLLLSPINDKKNRPTKILDKDLNKLESFDAGFKFHFETVPYKNFHKAMEKVFTLDHVFLVLGELTDYGQTLEETETPGPRRKTKGNPTIRDRLGCEMVLDLDDHVLDGFTTDNPVPAIKAWLKEKKIKCDVTWQITSGQKLNTEEARIRLYFEADKPYELSARKAWSQSPDIMADGSVYTCSQPIYTAPPIIGDNLPDPISVRSGFIKGATSSFRLPKLTEEQIKSYSGHSRGGEVYDFEDPTLPDDVISGKVYRRYFMPLAFHYANLLKGDREAIFHIIAGKANQIKNRNFNAENVYSFIDSALDKISSEQEDLSDTSHLFTADDFAKIPTEGVPVFPEDLLSTWPAPWPMLWENFKRIPRQTEEPLLVPTILALNAFFLKAAYVTSYNRRPNLFFLNLTPSTGNKDVNSKNVIRDLDTIFKKRGSISSLFTGIVSTESSITADTTFLQSFSESEEFFWVNTEATRIFQQIKNSSGNSNVAALSDKLIEVVDGHEITGKVKAGGKVKTIGDPNCQVLFYAQPETIEKFIDEEMVDSGLFGRSLLSIVPELEFKPSEYNMFLNKTGQSNEVDDDFYEFYTSGKFNLSSMAAHKTVLQPSKKNLILLNEWAREFVAPMMKEDDALQKVLSRVGNSAEQLYCIVLGICQKWDEFQGVDKRSEISVLPLIPLLEYWCTTKVYAIKHFISSELDPLAEAILSIIKGCVNGEYKASSSADAKILKEHHMVSESMLFRIMKNNTKLIRKLSADGDKRNAMVRAKQLVGVLTDSGIIERKDLLPGTRTKFCLGLIK